MLNRFATGLRRAVGGAVHDLSPIRLFNMQQARKLGDNLAGHAMPRALPRGIDRARRYRMAHSFGDRVSDWLGGHFQDDLAGPRLKKIRKGTVSEVYKRAAASRAMQRRTAVGVLGAATIGSMVFGPDNGISAGANAAITVGGVSVAAAGIAEGGMRAGRPATGALGAAGLVGWTALNMYRSGNNFGPF